MEFAGKKGSALFIASVLVAVVAGFGGGVDYRTPIPPSP